MLPLHGRSCLGLAAVYAVLLRNEADVVVLVVTRPYERLEGDIQIRIGCGGSERNTRTVGWIKVQVRIGHGGGEKVPVRSSGGERPRSA